jgi:hypothetical protein
MTSACGEFQKMPETAPTLPAVPDVLAESLSSDESVLWFGQPRPYVYILRGMTSISYGATWAILGAFWYHGSGGVGKYSAFEGWWRLVPLLSLPFILAGLSFFIHPIRLGARARRTWYVVTNRRVFIAELRANLPPELRVFSKHELASPLAVKRFDGLYNLVLTHRAQEQIDHLVPRLEDAFFGLSDPRAATAAIEQLRGDSADQVLR